MLAFSVRTAAGTIPRLHLAALLVRLCGPGQRLRVYFGVFWHVLPMLFLCVPLKISSILLLLLAVPAARLEAQIPTESPEAFTTRYVQKMKTGDWQGVAGLIHPDALQQLREMFRPILAADTSGEAAMMFFGVRDTVAFARMPAADVFAGLMATVTKAMPGFTEVMSSAQSEMVGHVDEKSRNLVHVVYRMTVTQQGVTVSKLEVMTLRPIGSEWRAMLTAQMEGLAAALTRGMQQRR
jgi:hypothetical protein